MIGRVFEQLPFAAVRYLVIDDRRQPDLAEIKAQLTGALPGKLYLAAAFQSSPLYQLRQGLSLRLLASRSRSRSVLLPAAVPWPGGWNVAGRFGIGPSMKNPPPISSERVAVFQCAYFKTQILLLSTAKTNCIAWRQGSPLMAEPRFL